jgi:hypothetical protein
VHETAQTSPRRTTSGAAGARSIPGTLAEITACRNDATPSADGRDEEPAAAVFDDGKILTASATAAEPTSAAPRVAL